MEIDPALHRSLTDANQTHLLAYWPELNDEQRKRLLQDIKEVDFDRVKRAYDGIKHELLTETNNNCDTKNETLPPIDDTMEPIPDQMVESICEVGKEQIEHYRLQGLKAISQGSVCVLLLAGGQGTRLGGILLLSKLFLLILLIGVDYPKGMFDVDLPSKKSLYQIQAERIRRLEQIANEQFNTSKSSIPWLVYRNKI